jgi:hypothetical protein
VVESILSAGLAAAATAVATRWIDERRSDREARLEVAREIRTHLAEAHRGLRALGETCSAAFAAVDAPSDQFNASLDAFTHAIAQTREQASEFAVREDPTEPRATAVLGSACEMALELRELLETRHPPQRWEMTRPDDVDSYAAYLLWHVEWKSQELSNVAVPGVTPLEPYLAAIIRRNRRRELRRVRRISVLAAVRSVLAPFRVPRSLTNRRQQARW